MRQRMIWTVTAVIMIVSAGVAYAHHSFAATYDDRKLVTIDGKIIAINYRNPHSFVSIDDKQGVRWGIEWGGVSQLVGQGMTRETLRSGDAVVITANPAREVDEHRALMKTLKRPSDGFQWGIAPGQVVE